VSKICITGTTRGLGKELCDYFRSQGHEVHGFQRGDDAYHGILGCDLFINNAYGDGLQMTLLNSLYGKVGKMVVMGSIASDYPDPLLPEYSKQKKELKERVMELANIGETPILLLQLSGESYNDPDLICKTIEFWIENPKVTSVSFIPGEPN
jgi:hypothetical protein